MKAEMKGVVSFWHPKAFGFIEAGLQKKVWVHQQALTDNLTHLLKGQEVEFTLVESPKGPQAANVRVKK